MIPTLQFDWQQLVTGVVSENLDFVAVAGDNFVSGARVPRDEAWWMLTWSAAHQDGVNRRVTVAILAPSGIDGSHLNSNAALPPFEWMTAKYPFLMPPLSQMSYGFHGMAAAAQCRARTYFVRFYLPRPGLESGTIETGIGRKPRFRFQL